MTWPAWSALFLQELKRTFSYRVSFWMQFFGATVGEVVIAVLLWRSIYGAGVDVRFGGFTLDEMIRYYILVAVLGRVVRGPENFQISAEIYDGSLTRFLIYPVSVVHFKMAERAAYLLMTVVQMAVALLILAPFVNVLSSLQNLAMGLTCALFASAFYFVLGSAVEMVAFWADNVWTLSVMNRFIVAFFSGLILPLTLFPHWAQRALDYSPFPSLAFLPIQLILGQSNLMAFTQGIFKIIIWTVVAVLIGRLIWMRGIKNYTGVGQ